MSGRADQFLQEFCYDFSRLFNLLSRTADFVLFTIEFTR